MTRCCVLCAVCCVALLATACGLRSPISHRVTVDLDRDGEHARVTAVTEVSQGESEAMVRQELDRLLAGNTCLVITHDLP